MITSRNKLYEAAGRPWEGDNTSLKAELIRACKWWSHISDKQCPIEFSDDEVEKCLDLDRRQVEADNQLQVLRDFFPINIEGWVPTHLYEGACERAEYMRLQMMDAAENDEERREIEELWPFQDRKESK